MLTPTKAETTSMSDFKVKDLIAQLQALDPELPVLLQKDPEGNGYFWASGAQGELYVAKEDLESDRSDGVYEVEDTGALLDPEMDDEARAAAISEEGYAPVVVVFP